MSVLAAQQVAHRNFQVKADIEYSENGFSTGVIDRTVRRYLVTVTSTWTRQDGSRGKRIRTSYAWTEKGAVRLAKRMGAEARKVERKKTLTVEV